VGGGALPLKDTIRLNSIYGNFGRGIWLADFHGAFNDPGRFQIAPMLIIKLPVRDTGPNNLQNYPVIQQIDDTNGGIQLQGTLKSKPSTTFHLDFYANDKPHPSGFGDGQTYLGSVDVTTNALGLTTFDTTVPSKGSGQYISATATDSDGNTSGFSLVCSDLDGIADAWKMWGIDYDEDGKVDLVLNGAHAGRKAIFVEVDVMQGAGIYTDSATGKTSLQLVQDAFARAPVKNRDGSTGIDLIIDTDNDMLPRMVLQAANGLGSDFDALKAAYFGTAQDRQNPSVLNSKRLIYHYCIIAADPLSDGSSGRAELPGNDFVIASTIDPNNLYRALDQAGTFMHELGHNLGLHHGGGGSDVFGFGLGDDTNFKPNYLSVMNYEWQMPGGRAAYFLGAYGFNQQTAVTFQNEIYQNVHFANTALQQIEEHYQSWVLDYSRAALPTLFEGALLESTGIGGDPSKLAILPPLSFSSGANNKFDTRPQFVPMGGPVDWNGNGTIDTLPVARDVDDLDLTGGLPIAVLAGHDDWSQLWYNFMDTGDGYADGVHDNIDSNEELANPLSTLPGGPATLAITPAPQTFAAGVPSQPITVQLRDSSGNAIAAGAGGVVLTLSTNSGGGVFLSTSGAALTGNVVNIAAGSSTVSFEYEDSKAGTPTLTVTSTGLTQATQQETIRVPVMSDRTPGDFDGDGKTDIGVYGPYGPNGSNRFAVLLSHGGAINKVIGGPLDQPVIGDFDGDGKADIGVYGPYGPNGSNRFAILLSGGGTLVKVIGGPLDRPVVGDFDADGKADLGVYGPYGPNGTNRFAILLSDGGTIVQTLGGPADVPVVGHFFGNGHDQVGVYGYGRYAILDPFTHQTQVQVIGGSADSPVVGDFNGDGKSDFGVYGPYGPNGTGRLAVIESGGGSINRPLGGPLDQFVAGDFDGDGKTDIAVYGPYGPKGMNRIAVLLSAGGTIVQTFGGPLDVALPPLTAHASGGRLASRSLRTPGAVEFVAAFVAIEDTGSESTGRSATVLRRRRNLSH
jgi:hypothetical protein